jgi:hypothetical protein
MNRKVIAFLTDPHSGHALGLYNPETKLKVDPKVDGKDYWTPSITPAQEWLWKHYSRDLKELSKFVGRDDLYVTLAGDVCQGNAHKSELVSIRDFDQVDISAQALDPIMRLKQLKRLIILKGTDAHEIYAGSLSMSVSAIMNGKYPGKVDNYFHPLLKIDGVNIDVSHHGPTSGKRAWLRGNELGWYVRDIMLDNLANGRRPPDVVARGHVHVYALAVMNIITDEETFYTLGMILPPMCLLDTYARKVAQSPPYVRTGIVALEIIDGKINYKPQEWLHTLHLRTERSL